MHPDPKPETYRNKDYLDWIRSQPCLICQAPSEPCHVRWLHWGAGIGKKPHDYVAIPLCRKCHSYANEREHGTDEQIVKLLTKYIKRKHGTIRQIAELLMRYIESKRKKCLIM